MFSLGLFEFTVIGIIITLLLLKFIPKKRKGEDPKKIESESLPPSPKSVFTPPKKENAVAQSSPVVHKPTGSKPPLVAGGVQADLKKCMVIASEEGNFDLFMRLMGKLYNVDSNVPSDLNQLGAYIGSGVAQLAILLQRHFEMVMKMKAAINSNKLYDAMDIGRSILEFAPLDSATLSGMGLINQRLGNYDEGRRQLEGVIKRDAEDGSAWNNLGLIFWSEQNNEEAKRHFIKALEINPGDQAARTNLIQLESNTLSHRKFFGRSGLAVFAFDSQKFPGNYGEAVYRILLPLLLKYSKGTVTAADGDPIFHGETQLFGQPERWQQMDLSHNLDLLYFIALFTTDPVDYYAMDKILKNYPGYQGMNNHSKAEQEDFSRFTSDASLVLSFTLTGKIMKKSSFDLVRAQDLEEMGIIIQG